jgi:hypothetical protein
VPGAEKCRAGVFVERTQLDLSGGVFYFEKTRQRGLSFGPPDEFREAVHRVTRRAYPKGGSWNVWAVEAGHSEVQPFEGSYEELKAVVGR